MKRTAFRCLRKQLLCRLSVDYFALCSTLGKGRIFFESGKIPNDGEVHGSLYGFSGLSSSAFKQRRRIRLSGAGQRTACFFPARRKFLQIKKNFNTKDDADRRIFLIMEYIYENCSGDINLQNIADRLYLSKSAVSRMFYKATGEHLKQYVNQDPSGTCRGGTGQRQRKNGMLGLQRRMDLPASRP